MKKKKKSLLILVGIFSFFLFLLYCFYSIITYRAQNIPNRIFITDRKGNIITDTANAYGYRISGKVNLDSQFVKDLLVIEDKQYFSHFGINILAKFRALKNNLLHGKVVSGGSTITEQYIKNKYFAKHKRSYLQKSREAVLAFYFSLRFDKEELLQEYLDNLYFGNNIYGLHTAAFVYFGVENIADLSEEQRVIFLGLLHSPGKNIGSQAFQKYTKKVKKRLGYSFYNTIPYLKEAPKINKFPFISNYAKTQKSSIDSQLQTFAEETLQKQLEKLQNHNVTNGAIFALDPKTMEVLVYVGSSDFYSKKIDGQVDVIRALRQPGSTFKPFLYLQALKKGAGANSLLLDIESSYDSFQEGKVYISENYSLRQYGLIPLQKALGNSLNNATVRLAREIGLENVYNFYTQFGFRFLQKDPKHYGYSFVLGNPSLTLENMVLAYVNLLPDYEIQAERKYTFDYIENEAQANLVYKKNKTLVDPEKYLLYKILQNPDNRDISFGVHSILNTSIPQAVKTGTSSNFRDNLVISYHPDFVIGVWIGNNNNSPMTGVTGITGAGVIWHQVVEKAIELGYIREKMYTIPTGISRTAYCLDVQCFQKQMNYDVAQKKYKSGIVNEKYAADDLFEQIEKEEIDWLGKLGFYLEK